MVHEMKLREFLATCDGIEKASAPETMYWLLHTVQDLQRALGRDPLCVEVGVWCGVTAVAMALGGGRVLCVDPFTGPDRQTRERTADCFAAGVPPLSYFLANAFRSGLCDRLLPLVALSLDVAALLPDACVDFVFIDGNHERCLDDVQAWGPKVRPGGILCGHDVGQAPVSQAAAWWAQTHQWPLYHEAGNIACWWVRTPAPEGVSRVVGRTERRGTMVEHADQIRVCPLCGLEAHRAPEADHEGRIAFQCQNRHPVFLEVPPAPPAPEPVKQEHVPASVTHKRVAKDTLSVKDGTA